MPSDQATWLISALQDGDAEGLLQELTTKIRQQVRTFNTKNICEFLVPVFKTGTLDLLITLSEELPKQDSHFTSVVAKIVDILRNLLNNDSQKLAQHTFIDDRSIDSYLLEGWKWNEGRYSVQKSLKELVDALNKDLTSIDNVMKSKLSSYNLAKGNLQQLQRKRTGNLSVRSLIDVVMKEDFVEGSEYLETLLVAVPKSLVRDWLAKYERLAPMVVPRSTKLIASDDEYSLYGVVVFKRARDEFAQKCRENKFTVRDFVFYEDSAEKQKQELKIAIATEKEFWAEMLHISRTNFSEAFKLLVHLKVLRLFVESVLRYGLPANYIGIIIKPEPKSQKRFLNVLTNHFSYLSARAQGKLEGKGKMDTEVGGEFQSILEQEFLDFVVFDVPWIVN